MQLSEIPNEQAHLWCPQELGPFFPVDMCPLLLPQTKQVPWSDQVPSVPRRVRGGAGVCVAQLGGDCLFLLVSSAQGSEFLVMAGKKESWLCHPHHWWLCHLNTECGWTEDPRTLQVCTYHNVCRPGVDWIVFRISVDEIKVSTQWWWFFNLTIWTNLETFSQHGRKQMRRVSAVLFSLPKLSQRWEETLRCSEQRP